MGNDNHELGKLLADIVIARLPPGAKGTVVLGTSSPGVPVLDNRAEGIRAEFARKLPGVRVLGAFDTRQEVSANLAAWETLVKANPDALAYLGTGDADGWHLADIRALTHASWLAGAFDLDPKALQGVKAGGLLLVSPEHFVKGATAGRLQAMHAKDSHRPAEGLGLRARAGGHPQEHRRRHRTSGVGGDEGGRLGSRDRRHHEPPAAADAPAQQGRLRPTPVGTPRRAAARGGIHRLA